MARVLVIGDTHCPGALAKYPAFLSKIEKQYKCNRIVHIGDLCDLNSISYHERNPSLPSASDEYRAAKKQIQEFVRRFPKVDLLLGNHDSLAIRQAVTAGLLPEWLKDFNTMFELPATWKVHPRFTELRIDDATYWHGDAGRNGQGAALKNAMAKFTNVVQGHHHAECSISYYCNGEKKIWGMSVGCGVDHRLLAFEYGRKFTRKPICSAAVVLDGFPIIIPMEL